MGSESFLFADPEPALRLCEVTPEQIQGWLQIGVAGFLLMALLLGHRRVWVFGWFAESVEKDRDFWRDIALRSMGHAEKAIGVASRNHDG